MTGLQDVHKPTVDLLRLLLPILCLFDCLLQLVNLLKVQRFLLFEVILLLSNVLLHLSHGGAHRCHLLRLGLHNRLKEARHWSELLPLLPRAAGAMVTDQPISDGLIQGSGRLPELRSLMLPEIVDDLVVRD